MRARPRHPLLAALCTAGLLATPLGGLLARTLPEDPFEPPLAPAGILSAQARADLGAWVESLPEPVDPQAWRAEELNAEERLLQAPVRRSADLYRAPLAPEWALQGPGSPAASAGGAPRTPQADADSPCAAGLPLESRRQTGRRLPGSAAGGFLPKNTYFSIRNGYAGPGRWTRVSWSPCLPAAPCAPHPAPQFVVVPTLVSTSPEFPV